MNSPVAPPPVVTTPLEASVRDQAAAATAAARHGLALVARRGRSLAEVAAAAAGGPVLVVGARRVALWAGGTETTWHGGMGQLRARRLLAGERTTRDAFLEAAGLAPGDAVLDGTLGLGMDALVAAAAVGPAGRVVGVEASAALAAFTAEGLARHGEEAARRVEVVRADAGDYLARAPERSFDVVVFDPMFRHPRPGAASFDVVRRLAHAAPLAPGTLARARAVARRWVVVKDGTPGWDLARLGLQPLPSARGAHRLYARVPAL